MKIRETKRPEKDKDSLFVVVVLHFEFDCVNIVRVMSQLVAVMYQLRSNRPQNPKKKKTGSTSRRPRNMKTFAAAFVQFVSS